VPIMWAMKRTASAWLVAVFFLAFAALALANAQACTDLRSVDLKNSVITTLNAKEDANQEHLQLRHSLNRAAGMRVLHFDRGEAKLFYKDGLIEVAGIHSDSPLHVNDAEELRFVVINVGNRADGAWQYVLVLGCRNQALVTLFQYSAWRMRAKILADGDLLVDHELYREGDSACCASLHRRSIYRWSAKEGKIALHSRSRLLPLEH